MVDPDEDEPMVEPAVPEPAVPEDDAPVVERPDEPMVDPAEPDDAPLVAGLMAGEPEVVDPDPVAMGRSVEPDEVEVWARAGAAASAVAIRQAAMCVLIIGSVSWMFGFEGCASRACPFNVRRTDFVQGFRSSENRFATA